MEKRTAKLEHVKASETASLYTIIFENNDMSEFSKFMTRFKDNGYVLDLQQFDALLKEAEKEGSIKIEETNITGSENKIFEL